MRESDNKEQIISLIEDRINNGLLFESFNRIVNAMKTFPDSVRLRQLRGLTLARLGQTLQARNTLEELYQEGHRDSETMGLLARVYKDLYRKNNDPLYASLSKEIYYDNYRTNKSHYTGINAASMSLILGEKSQAQEIAVEILSCISPDTADIWELASRGEASLITGDIESAVHAYKQVRSAAGDRIGYLSSINSQLHLLSRVMDIPEQVLSLLKPAPMIIFTGHMIDHPERQHPRFPESIADAVSERIEAAIKSIGPAIGFTSASCGADILFIEAMERLGHKVVIYLPFEKDDFIKTSVSFPGEEWVNRFNRIIEEHDIRYLTGEGYLGNDFLFDFLGKVLFGMAILHADLHHGDAHLLGVVNSSSKGLAGGSHDIIRHWPENREKTIIDIADLQKKSFPAAAAVKPAVQRSEDAAGLKRELRSILFADIVGYSRVEEDQTPIFLHHILKRIAGELSSLPAPDILNTWGDAVFAVFPDPSCAVKYALAMQSAIINRDGSGSKLPEDINIRIALHVGPVFVADDPLTGRNNAYGSHINRAARIEPVTLPGKIYVSEQFAAMLAFISGENYSFTYVGRIALPKKFGEQELYLLEPVEDSNPLDRKII
jgi:class 3 adenylate cyclase/tetratricopeptide (TPR) repeat protein